jgi:hypothetical protein
MSVNNVKDNKCLVPVPDAVKGRYTFEIEEIVGGTAQATTWQDAAITIDMVAIASLQTNANTNLQIQAYTKDGVVGVVVYNAGQSTYQNIVVNVAVL